MSFTYISAYISDHFLGYYRGITKSENMIIFKVLDTHCQTAFQKGHTIYIPLTSPL